MIHNVKPTLAHVARYDSQPSNFPISRPLTMSEAASVAAPSGLPAPSHPNPTAAAAPAASPSSIAVTLEASPASLHFNDRLFWLSKHRTAADAAKASPSSLSTSFLCIPLDLVLDTSFVPDSDGGSLYVRLLAPPPQSASPFLPFTKVKSRPSLVAETDASFAAAADTFTSDDRVHAERLRSQLEGPCKKLRLVKIEARTHVSQQDASQWVSRLLAAAYHNVKPYRRLKVLINPVGGPGKARQLFQAKVRPILEAAGCVLDIEPTRYANHAYEIAKALPLDRFDALLFVSGDGLAHEVLNGFAQRPDAASALRIPICPIPAGSGNGLCVNLLGPEQGFNLALACLNAIKGRPLPLDICVVTQPRASGRGKDAARRSSASKRRQSTLGLPTGARNDDVADGAAADPTPLAAAPDLPYDQYYSFLSQAIGLMADIDLGTEHLRALGDTRFVVGFIQGVISNNECPVQIDVKLGAKGSKNKEQMRKTVHEYNARGQWSIAADPTTTTTTTTGMPSLQHGAVTDPLPNKDQEKTMSLHDPSWPYTVLKTSPNTIDDPPAGEWVRLDASISALYAGKIPFVGRDLMQFPFALPGDGTVDLALLLHEGGRAGKLRAISDAETGAVVYDRSMAYLKVEAYRVTPKLAAGDARLKKGGLVSIDGEHRPYAPYQVEVSSQQATTLSLFGRFNVSEVSPPAVTSS